jgi:vacuolar-type H+-ATPase subunit C/Vma6
MLTRFQLDRLIDVRSENQIISALADTPYGEARAEDVDRMLSRATLEEDAFFRRYLEEEKVADFFSAPDLASNLKWSLRLYYGAEIDEALFMSEGSPSPEEFARMLEGEETSLSEWIREAAGEVIVANYEQLDPASIDLIVDKALVEYQYELSKGYSFLRTLLSLQVDFANLLTMLRLKVADDSWESFEQAFLPHGEVKKERFKAWWDASAEAWATQIIQVDRYAKLTDGLREAKDSFLLLERFIKEAEIEFLLTARRLTFGYEPLVGYALLKREERRNISKVVAGLRYGLEAENIRKSIAWFD